MGERGGFGRDGNGADRQERDGDYSPRSLSTDNHIESSEVSVKASVSTQSDFCQRFELRIQVDDEGGYKYSWHVFYNLVYIISLSVF